MRASLGSQGGPRPQGVVVMGSCVYCRSPHTDFPSVAEKGSDLDMLLGNLDTEQLITLMCQKDRLSGTSYLNNINPGSAPQKY